MNKFSMNGPPQSKQGPPSYQSNDSYTSLDPQQQRFSREREGSPPRQYENKHKSRIPVVLHIKLSKDLVKEVRCFSDDDPELLAKNFCQENNLPPELTPVVQKMIKAQFNQALEAKGQRDARSKSPTVNSAASSPSRDEYAPVRDRPGKPAQQQMIKKSEPNSKAGFKQEEYREEQSHSKLIAKLDINIGPSQSRELLLFEGEDPAEVAYFFCSQNDLPNNIIEVLITKLKNAQELYYRKKGKNFSEAGSSMMQSNSQNRSKAQLDKEDVAQSIPTPKIANSLNQVNMSEKSKPGSTVLQSNPRSKAHLDREEGPHQSIFAPKAANSLNQVNMSEKGKPGSSVIQSQTQIKSKTQLDKPELAQPGSIQKVPNSLNQVNNVSERSGRSKSPPGTAVYFGQIKAPGSLHESIHSKQSEKDTLLNKLESHGISDKTQPFNSSQLGSNETKGAPEGAADMYERWQNLIKERRMIQQIEPENNMHSTGKFAAEKKPSDRSKTPPGRSKTPTRREVNPEEYYKLAMKSMVPSDTGKAKVENIGQIDRVEEEANKRKLNKKEAGELIDRLYGDAMHRKANEDEYKLFELGVRPMREARDLTFKPGFWERREGSPDLKGRPVDEPRSPTPREIREHKLTVQENKVKDMFTFKPYVSDASRKLLERKNRSTSPIHDRLHTDGMASKKHKDVLFEVMLEETCPFQPNVEKYRNAPVKPEPDFFKKLTQRELKKQDKKYDKLKEETQPLKDPVTGQEFFKPKINKDQYYYRVKERDDAKEKEMILKARAAQKEKERIVNASKSLREIFNQLDDDYDGYISAKKIELSKLDSKVLEALIKVFDIIEDGNLRVDFEGFENLIEENLDFEQRNILKNEYEEGDDEEQRMVQPNGSHTMDRSVPSYTMSKDVDVSSQSRANRTQRSPGERKRPKVEEVERVTEKNLTKHYQRLLGKKEESIME